MPFVRLNILVNMIEHSINCILGMLNISPQYYFTYESSSILDLNKEHKRIQVENIKGDICLFAGKKDRIWNSVHAFRQEYDGHLSCK